LKPKNALYIRFAHRSQPDQGGTSMIAPGSGGGSETGRGMPEPYGTISSQAQPGKAAGWLARKTIRRVLGNGSPDSSTRA